MSSTERAVKQLEKGDTARQKLSKVVPCLSFAQLKPEPDFGATVWEHVFVCFFLGLLS